MEEENLAAKEIDTANNTSPGNTDDESNGESIPKVDDDVRESIKRVLSESNLLQPLVSSIVSVVLLTPEVFNPLVDAVSKALTNKISEKLKPNIEQNLYEAVSMDMQGTKKEVSMLTKELTKIRNEKNQLELRVDDAEQYSRRNCLLLHGVPENPNEDTTSVVTGIIKNKLNIDIESHDFDRTHRLGQFNRQSDDKKHQQNQGLSS